MNRQPPDRGLAVSGASFHVEQDLQAHGRRPVDGGQEFDGLAVVLSREYSPSPGGCWWCSVARFSERTPLNRQGQHQRSRPGQNTVVNVAHPAPILVPVPVNPPIPFPLYRALCAVFLSRPLAPSWLWAASRGA